MKKTILILSVFALIASGCKEATKNQMIMTLEVGNGENISFALIGDGTATIDWGDGSPVKTHKIKPHEGDNDDYTDNMYRHIYSNASTYIITITGGNITLVECDGIGLTNLDVSKTPQLAVLICTKNSLTGLDVSNNTNLVVLRCDMNGLTALDVSNNAELRFLDCGINLLSANALNNLFESLNNGDLIEKTILIHNNPGTADCQTDIAKNKGWEVILIDDNEVSEVQEEEVVSAQNETDETAEFMQKVKNAIAENDKEWLANHIRYPLNTTLNGEEKITVENKQQLIDNFEQIFYPAYKEQIEKHSLSDLFSNWQGTMLGNGEIWIDENIIIAINNNSEIIKLQ